MRRFVILAAAACAAIPFLLKAQDKPADSPAPALTPEEQAIADQANAYEAAFNKGDLKALEAMFAEDAEWVTDAGDVYSGRAEIAAMIKQGVASRRPRTLEIDVESVRRVTPDVLVEKGSTTVTEADGHTTLNTYTSVHVKKGDGWLISQLTETGSPLTGAASRQLGRLDWLVGSWTDSSDGAKVRTNVQWAANRTFLTRSFALEGGDGDETAGTEVIGWDPSLGKVRSWTFEADGSFSEKLWTQDGPRWLIKSRTVLPDGSLGSEEQTLNQVDKDKFTWASRSREVDGEALPNLEPITIVRAK